MGVRVQLLQEWLSEALETKLPAVQSPARFKLFGHCTERTACTDADAMWTSIYERLGLELTPVSVGSCGLCGVFGHEAEHVGESKGVYDLSWRTVVDNAAETVVATGYSCRSQVKR